MKKQKSQGPMAAQRVSDIVGMGVKEIEEMSKLTESMAAYERATGNRIENVVITSQAEDGTTVTNEIRHTEEDPVNGYASEPCDNCCGCCVEPDKVMTEEEYISQHIRENIVLPILTAHPISTINAQQIISETALPQNQQNFMTEVRDHNHLMAYTVGQIAYATTAMLLEYQTQCMANNEMCRIVDKDGNPAYKAPDPDYDDFDEEVLMLK